MTLSHSAFLLSSKTKTRSKRLSRGLASATLTDRGSLGSYWPFGLVAARMVVLVFSLHTILWTEEEDFHEEVLMLAMELQPVDIFGEEDKQE